MPNLCANGAYKSLVSIAIRFCLFTGKYSIVLILCNLSENLIIITLKSLDTDKNIFIKFSAC